MKFQRLPLKLVLASQKKSNQTAAENTGLTRHDLYFPPQYAKYTFISDKVPDKPKMDLGGMQQQQQQHHQQQPQHEAMQQQHHQL